MSGPIKPQSVSHWYRPDGTPAYEVPKKNGEMRPTHLGDARKLGLYPSVTSILKIVDKPFLSAWIANQSIGACVTISQELGRPLTDDDMPLVKERAKEVSVAARETGTAYHDAIEKILSGMPGSFEIPEATVDAFLAVFREHQLTTGLLEHSFASADHGFAGRIDFIGTGAIRPDDNTLRHVVLDWKTQRSTEGKPFTAYPEMGCQLAAYADGIGKADADLGIVFISTTEPDRVELRFLPNNERFFTAFLKAFALWKDPILGKGYEPLMVK